MNKQEIKSEIKYCEEIIRGNKMTLAGCAKDMVMFKVFMVVCSTMALASLPAAYAAFGEDGILLGAVILVITSMCAFAQYMLIERVKLTKRDAIYMINLAKEDIESMQKYGRKPIR